MPLSGLLVLEFGTAIAGPTVGRHLAAFGADVVKVESPTRTDAHRAFASASLPPDADPRLARDTSALFAQFNAGKRSLAVDLADPRGRDVILRLYERCDVVVSSMGATVLDRLGLGYAEASARNPGVVFCAMPGFGSEADPRRDHKVFGNNLGPLAGLDHLTGWPDRGPVGVTSCTFLDYAAAGHATTAIHAALHARRRDPGGQGMFIDVSQYESAVALLGPFIAEESVRADTAKAPRVPVGNRREGVAPGGVYAARGDDRWIVLACPDERAWHGLCRAASGEPFATDPAYATVGLRVECADALDDAIDAWSGRLDAAESVARLRAEGVLAAEVADSERVLADPQLRARGFFAVAPHARLGGDLVTRFPARCSRTNPVVRRAAPCLGEDTTAVLRDIAGYAEHEIAALAADGVAVPMPVPHLRHRRARTYDAGGEATESAGWGGPEAVKSASSGPLPTQRARDGERSGRRGSSVGERSGRQWSSADERSGRQRRPREVEPSNHQQPAEKPLRHLRVIELGHPSTAYAGKLLADLGADVVLIEHPDGDPLRAQPPFLDVRSPQGEVHRVSLRFETLSAAKRIRVLDLTTAPHRAELDELLGDADALLFGGHPSRWDALDVPALLTAHPQLTAAAVTPYGLTGPLRDTPGDDLTAWAAAGLLTTSGEPDRRPLHPAPGADLAHIHAGQYAAHALLACLHHPDGQVVDIALHEVMASLGGEYGPAVHLDDGLHRRRPGPRSALTAGFGLFPAKDGQVAVVCALPWLWSAIAHWTAERTGNDAITSEAFAGGPQVRSGDLVPLLNGWIEDLTRTLTRAELYEEGQRRGAAITPVNTLADVLSDPHLTRRAFFETLDIAGHLVTIPGPPHRLSRRP